MNWRTRSRLERLTVLLIVLATILAGCLGDGDDDGNGDDGKAEEVLANAGPDLVGEVGKEVTFNASTSSGPIVKYTWVVTSGNLSSSQPVTLEGEVVDYTFTVAGVYLVNLTVEGDKGQNATDSLFARIDLLENVTGHLSMSPSELNETYERTVTPDVQKIELTLMYPSEVGPIIGAAPVYLEMEVFAGGSLPIASTTGQQRDSGDTQTETLDVPLASVIDNGGFRILVRWQGAPVGPVGDVDFTLQIDIFYHSA